jgi:hypothetical protein
MYYSIVILKKYIAIIIHNNNDSVLIFFFYIQPYTIRFAVEVGLHSFYQFPTHTTSHTLRFAGDAELRGHTVSGQQPSALIYINIYLYKSINSSKILRLILLLYDIILI